MKTTDSTAVKARELIPFVDLPEGQIENWRVERFTITEEEARFDRMRASFQAGMGGRGVRAGTYTRLMRGRTVVMSDTPAEKSDHFAPVRMAKGRILINGLGLGMVLNACLLLPDVTHATVVEKSAEVIELVGPHYTALFGERLTLVNADALHHLPAKGERFGMVWHDIWDHICVDNLKQMHALHRKYGRRADWQGSWCRELCEFYKR